MSLVIFQHAQIEDAAKLGSTLIQHGHRLDTIELFAGQSVPTHLEGVDGVVSLGGPMNVEQGDAYPWMAQEMDYLKTAHQAGVPVLGICLGAQLIATALGGKVQAMDKVEVGYETVTLAFPGTVDPLFSGIPWSTPQFHMHGQHISQLPSAPGTAPLASSANCKTQAFKVGFRTYGFQYHFEWDAQNLAIFGRDALVAQSSKTPDQIRDQDAQFYHRYRRLGDRLCQNIANLLFPLNVAC